MKRALRFLSLILVLWEGHASALSDFECLRDLIPVTEVAARQIKRQKPLQAPEIFAHGRFLFFPERDHGFLDGLYIYEMNHVWYLDTIEDLETGKTLKLSEAAHDGLLEKRKLIFQPGLETIDLPLGLKSSDAPLARLKTTRAQPIPDPLSDELRLRQAWIRAHNLDSESFRVVNSLLKSGCTFNSK